MSNSMSEAREMLSLGQGSDSDELIGRFVGMVFMAIVNGRDVNLGTQHLTEDEMFLITNNRVWKRIQNVLSGIGWNINMKNTGPSGGEPHIELQNSRAS